MTIQIALDGARIPIDLSVFIALFDNSVANGRAPYRHALETSQITFQEFVDLARYAEIPYSLFFAPIDVVEEQLALKTRKLLQGVTKDTFSLNSRNKVELRDIELIVKDLLRKQELLKANDDTLVKNSVVGALRRRGASSNEDAAKMLDVLGIGPDGIRSARNKTVALDYLIGRLEVNQILVAQSQNNYMPQRLTGLKFSGITIKDNKVPYIFLAGGDEGEQAEPAGRKVFTLTLMAVLIARGIFAPVTYDGKSTGPNPGYEYEIVAQMLMPEADFRRASFRTLDEIKETAEDFKVTPSAVVVRALRLGRMDQTTATEHLRALAIDYETRPRPQPRPAKPVNAIRKYNGIEFSRRMLGALDAGKLTPGDFCRAVCLNKIKPTQIGDFRAAIR